MQANVLNAQARELAQTIAANVAEILGGVKMADFPRVKLADCVDLLAGFAFKSQHFTDRPDDIALVKGENVSQGCILWDISKRWPAADWQSLEKFQLHAGDVVIAMDRPWVPAGMK